MGLEMVFGSASVSIRWWEMQCDIDHEMSGISVTQKHESVRIGADFHRYASSMLFTKRLRDGVRRGEITTSVRIWMRPHVKVGNRYRMEEGEIEIDSIEPIGLPDITPELARASGFLGVLDLLKVAKHGRGQNIYLVRFHYIPPRAMRVGKTGAKCKV